MRNFFLVVSKLQISPTGSMAWMAPYNSPGPRSMKSKCAKIDLEAAKKTKMMTTTTTTHIEKLSLSSKKAFQEKILASNL
jgi:hypothetical protein